MPSLSPLAGIRVLDLSRILAGPYCTMLLGDLGAEIIKIERPGVGDDTRTWVPPYVNGQSCYFVSVNRNKKSVCLDLKHPEGRNIAQKLAQKSDVLVENFIPGVLDRLGLGFDKLSSMNEKLVYCSLTGWGRTGPYAQQGGYDVIAAAVGGLMSITGPEMASLVNIGSNVMNADAQTKRWGSAHESIVPYQAFKTTDGFFMVGAGTDSNYQQLCQILDRPELEDAMFATNEKRVRNRNKLIPILNDMCV